MATTLKIGDRGELVKRLQAALISFGFNLGPTGADGGFGNRTKAAVKSFQISRGLPATGVADPDTLAAMDLDPDTLEDLIKIDGNVEIITFEPDEVDVPPVVQKKISTFVELVAKQHNKLLNSLINALANFETTMSFASAENANPDVFGALVSKVYEIAMDEVVSKVPGLSQAKALFDATTAELERAGKASESFQVGSWIKDQRSAIDAQLRGNITKGHGDLLQADMESNYLEQDVMGRQALFDQINQAINSLSGVTGPSLDEMESNLYLQWINAHFKRIGADTPGCIEYRLEYDDNTFDFESCTVKAPFGDKIDSALNRLLDQGQLLGIQRPFDFKVRKRVCLFVENFVGGHSWSCGWLDEEGNIIHDPVHPPARKGLRENAWWLLVDRFKS
jgi:Putative peptidoglycan binding domain